jgi:hypothetical protein
MIDTESDPGAWADAIAHSYCLRVEDYAARDAAGLHLEVRLGASRGARP